MAYKTITVYFNRLENAEKVAKYASLVARKFDAHLIGAYVTDFMEVHTGISAFVEKSVLDAFEADQQKRMGNVKAVFESVVKNETFPNEWRSEPSRGDAGRTLCKIARSSDLIIMPQVNSDEDRNSYKHTLETVIRTSGRPVLMIPFAGNFDTVGDNILVGWSPTKEATRAVHDALPFISSSHKTTVMSVGDDFAKSGGSIGSPSGELAAVLTRHGAQVSVTRRPEGEISIGDQLLNEAFEQGSDLIVTGAYGHSALYDFVIGATTSQILDHMTAPVFLSN